MSVNLVNLKYFHDTIKLGSLSAAAKANFVTQSAISQGITKLEKSLHVSLLAHHPNRLRLTPEGERAFQAAGDILRSAAAFKETVSKDVLGDLEFASTYSFAIAVIPQYLKRFKATYPDANVNFYMGRNADIGHMLKTGVIDFGIGPNDCGLTGFEKIDIYTGSFGLYVAACLTTKEAKKLHFIVAEGDCQDTIHFKETYRKKYKKDPVIGLMVNSWEMIANLTKEGLGIGYFPDYIAKAKRCLKPYDLGLTMYSYTISAFFPRGMKLRKSSELFLSYFDSATNFRVRSNHEVQEWYT